MQTPSTFKRFTCRTYLEQPLSAYKLALFLEMPRSTVAGRLDFLEKNGFVVKHGSAYRVSDQRLKSSAILDRATKIIRDTCDALALGEKTSVGELQEALEGHPR